ncbi:MAG: hypothetical protein ACRDQD_26520 [Nocardioidaceae bacterium]
MSRPTLVAAASTVLLLAGCGDSTDELSAEAEWADNICRTADDVSGDLSALTDAVQFDTNSDTRALKEAQSELADRAEAVQQSTSDLGAAVTDLPADADAAIVDAQQELSALASDLEASIDALDAAVSDAADANTSQQFAMALTNGAAAAAATQNDLSTLTDRLTNNAESTQDTVQQAFQDAPSCQN